MLFGDGQSLEERIIDKVTDWVGERISSRDWQELVAGTRIDYVVVGDVTTVRMKNPREVNLLNPSATARYRVINTRTGTETFKRETIANLGESDDELQVPAFDLGRDTRRIEHLLLVKLGQKIGKELYGYYSDW